MSDEARIPADQKMIADLSDEIERLRAENDVLHKTDKWRYETVLQLKAEIKRLEAAISLGEGTLMALRAQIRSEANGRLAHSGAGDRDRRYDAVGDGDRPG